MTATEAKNLADKRIAERQEEKELYDKIQQQIAESANRGSYGTVVYLKSNSFEAVRAVVSVLHDADGFECRFQYENGRGGRIVVSWENAEN